VLSLAELGGAPVIQREPGSMTRALFEAACDQTGLARVPGLEVGSREALKEAVAAGLGRGILLDGEAGDDPRLAFVKLRGPGLDAVVCAVALREMREVPAVAAFLAIAAADQPGARRPAAP
jgi:DNA-binding transcriptional LysR family regulator